MDHLDGVSIAHEDWRMNLRKSNTEPLVRLNVETYGAPDLLRKKTDELTAFIEGMRVTCAQLMLLPIERASSPCITLRRRHS